MEITVLCTDRDHPVVDRLLTWAQEIRQAGHSVCLLHDTAALPGGDVLFLVSCGRLVDRRERGKYKAALVLHASDLPRGRGWSPHIWAILKGENRITVSLLEADEPVDSGAVWLKATFQLEGHELADEINQELFRAELELMTQAIEHFAEIAPTSQTGEPGEYLPKRSPADSRLDPYKTIVEQFDLLRVADSERYPAFFDHRGKRYVVRIEKDDRLE